jgi:hypothetical protein
MPLSVSLYQNCRFAGKNRVEVDNCSRIWSNPISETDISVFLRCPTGTGSSPQDGQGTTTGNRDRAPREGLKGQEGEVSSDPHHRRASKGLACNLRVRLASAGPSGGRTQGGRMAAPFGRPRTPPREVCPVPPGVRGGCKPGPWGLCAQPRARPPRRPPPALPGRRCRGAPSLFGLRHAGARAARPLRRPCPRRGSARGRSPPFHVSARRNLQAAAQSSEGQPQAGPAGLDGDRGSQCE